MCTDIDCILYVLKSQGITSYGVTHSVQVTSSQTKHKFDYRTALEDLDTYSYEP